MDRCFISENVPFLNGNGSLLVDFQNFGDFFRGCDRPELDDLCLCGQCTVVMRFGVLRETGNRGNFSHKRSDIIDDTKKPFPPENRNGGPYRFLSDAEFSREFRLAGEHRTWGVFPVEDCVTDVIRYLLIQVFGRFQHVLSHVLSHVFFHVVSPPRRRVYSVGYPTEGG